MKIVMVFDGLATGGITRVGADYANMLIKKRYDVDIINLIPEKNDMSNAFDKKCNIYQFKYPRNMVFQRFSPLCLHGLLGVILYALISLPICGLSNLYKLHCRIKLYNCKKVDIDIAIAFSGHYNDLSFVANNFIKSKNKMAWLHGTEFEYKIISDGFFDLFRRIKNLVSLSDVGNPSVAKFNSKFGISNRKIYNPINLSTKSIDNTKVNLLKDKYGKFAIMVGRLGVDKDQKTVIDAIKIVNDEYGCDLNLLLVGDGPCREMLQQYTESKAMNTHVFFMGTCSDVQNYYSAAEIFVHSSPLEGLPTVLLEAMYYGLPIAATDSFPGVGEILKNGEFGLISPVYNAELLAENIAELMNNNDLRKQLICRSKERLKDFTAELSLEKLLCYIDEITKKG